MFGKPINNKRRAVIISVFVACMLALASLSACQLQTNTKVESNLTPQLDSSATITPGTLTVGINASNSPYGGTNSSNQTVGIDVDVAAAIAQELGLRMQIVDVGSNGRSALNNGQVDVAMGLTKSGTGDIIAYSDSYIDDGLSLFCLSTNKPVSINDVAAQVNAGSAKILVQADTAAATKVGELLGTDKVVIKSTMQAAFDALSAGDELYLVTDAVVGDYFARNYENIIRMGFLGADCVVPMYAITLTQNSALSSGVNNAIKTIEQNGIMQVIALKWLGEDGKTLLPANVDTAALPAKAFGLQEQGGGTEGAAQSADNASADNTAANNAQQ